MDRPDVRVVERCEQLRLALESREAIRIEGEDSGQHFQRDVSIEPRVARSIDFAHPAGTDGSDDFERAQLRSWSERHYGVPAPFFSSAGQLTMTVNDCVVSCADRTRKR